jgi:Xaa-Pro aminopeptidase
VDISYEMHTTAMKMARPGIVESDISGAIEGIALQRGSGVAFPVILSVNGQILHNHAHGNIMQEGDLLVNDSGAQTNMNYAGDITRTIPVSGKFTSMQRDIYEIVLKAQVDSIEVIKPGSSYRDIHLLAAETIATGLKELGLMKGNIQDAVAQGAHALFFPHGLGHMMGLDVHDMENFGEQYVGYDESVQRSQQFGLAYLRLAKSLKPGYVLTVEPGIYFIPDLINQWKNSNKFENYIEYTKITEYLSFGGIRIEDDVLVTETGNRILGKAIPKTVKDVESMCQSAI